MEDENFDLRQSKPFKITTILNIIIAILGIIILSYYLLSAPNENKIATIHVSSGESLNSITSDIESKNTVRYSSVLKFFVILFKSDRQITTGDYLFEKNQPVFKIAWQIARGNHNVNPIKITFKEGITNEEMATILADKLPGFRRDLFLTNIDTKQGYLFPDTYSFYPLTTTEEIVNTLSSNFKKRISLLNSKINSSGKSLSDIVTMASILEKEAAGKDDAPIISGILWNRIKMGMPLQVDAAMSTYKTKGLPDEPISNPGLSTIDASLNPISSTYLFYLHDKNGVVHFSKTYQEHKLNINRYLK